MPTLVRQRHFQNNRAIDKNLQQDIDGVVVDIAEAREELGRKEGKKVWLILSCRRPLFVSSLLPVMPTSVEEEQRQRQAHPTCRKMEFLGSTTRDMK